MAQKYVAKSEGLMDALTHAKITTAVELALVTGLSRNTAGSVMAGKAVTLATVQAVVAGLQGRGVRRSASHLFTGAGE